MTTYYAVTVDTEEEWPWDSGWPSRSPELTNIDSLPQFQEACSSHDAAVTYFTDHAVLNDDAATALLQEVADRTHVEIGMHIHPWNTPPLNGTPATARNSFLANLPDQLVRAKLETVYASFISRGFHPTSFRGGRYSTGPVVQSYLCERGFVADASIVPYTTWPDDGAPDYRHRGLFPERRSFADGAALWEVPLTLAFTRRPHAVWSATHRTVADSFLRRLRLIGIADRLNIVRRVWLSFEDPLGEHMLQFLGILRRLALPCICFTLHSSSLLVGANGTYSNTPAELQRLYDRLEAALSLLAGWPEFQPATISEIANHLEQQHHACSRHQPA